MSSSKMDKSFEYWKHQLLDLGRRNKMINYRETRRSTIRLIEPSIEELYRRIAVNEESLTFKRAVDRQTDVRVFSILSLLENLSSPLHVTIGDIGTNESTVERQTTLKNLRSKARLALEEQGTNVLYISFGFIEWTDGRNSAKNRIKSPLILVPAVLSMESLNAPYTLSRHEDDIVVNPTLQYYLKNEYCIDLPSFDAEKDTIEGYLERLEGIADTHGWKILREVSLGLLSFSKIAMYNDLVQNEARIKANPVIRAICGEPSAVSDIPDRLFDFDHDSIPATSCYQALCADSSQMDALLYARNGVSFVMQGPPGSGKSQTIANMIAEAIASGKKVLFVSEKRAALEVVHRRLREANLADFCLPLHSYKANKRDILERIGAVLGLKSTNVSLEMLASLDELSVIRNELNKYANELHSLNPELYISCYEAYGKLEELQSVPFVAFFVDSPLDVTREQLQLYITRLKEYSLAIERIGNRSLKNPWEGLRTGNVGSEVSVRMQSALSSLVDSMDTVSDFLSSVTECPDLVRTLSLENTPAIIEFIKDTSELSDVPSIWLKEADMSEITQRARELSARYQVLSGLEQAIYNIFSPEIDEFDYNTCRINLLSAAEGLSEMPYTSTSPAEFFIEHHTLLKSCFLKIRESLEGAISAVSAINTMLGTDLAVNPACKEQIGGLFSVIERGRIIPSSWLYRDSAELRAVISGAKRDAERLLLHRKRILLEWDEDILSLDCDAILYRYKTEYNGMLKFLNVQYNQDRMRLQALSLGTATYLSDASIISVLNDLKEYHRQMACFEANKNTLSELLGVYYNGLETNWDSALEALNSAERLRSIYKSNVPDEVARIVSSEQSYALETLYEHLNTVATAFNQIKETAFEGRIELDTESTDFNGIVALKYVNEYVSHLDRISAAASSLSPYLVCQDTSVSSVFGAIEALSRCKQLTNELLSKKSADAIRFGSLYADKDTDWDKIIRLSEMVKRITSTEIPDALKPLLSVSAQRKRELLKGAEGASRAVSGTRACLEWIASQFTVAPFDKSMRPSEISTKAIECLSDISAFDSWMDYIEAKKACRDAGLGDFIDKIEAEGVRENIPEIFLKGFYGMWLGAACDKISTVRRFRRNAHDERVSKFVELDDLQLLIARKRIREKLIEGLPTENQQHGLRNEIAILNRELGKKRNIMPLRRLFGQIPNLLLTLKPCLMMSPHSVSYFLEAEAYKFDLVIFDEASQVFPEDAVGAIFRGSQVVIAGDSKQLPPTSFFATTNDNSDGVYDINDEDYFEPVSDSILEQAASVLPTRTLLWHYRSKHESLIAFSNIEMYNNSLVTFPSAVSTAPDTGVEYIHVRDGCYEGGGRNCNMREAEECVRLVCDHIQRHPERSLGIIAFSEKQQLAIENAIIYFRERNPEYESFFDESRDEPFFVKNLENVQGDERDTVIFSICYARDTSGKMHMRFGPLGHEGGERRLNVAITRARCNIKLVGSILPTDINLGRTSGAGVRMLKSYIEYARRGTDALKRDVGSEMLAPRDYFCNCIADFLRRNGYIVETQVGCSDYKVDIAVKNPNDDGEYIAGIECDGLSYISARTARDRDHLRAVVLKSMGWKLYRLWSSEWVRNPLAEKAALLDFLREISEKSVSAKMTTNNADDNDESLPECEIAVIQPQMNNETESAHNSYGLSYYETANWQSAPRSDDDDIFTVIGETVRYITSVEQPIHKKLLYERMIPQTASEKASENIRETIDEAISQGFCGEIITDNDGFLLIPETCIVARIPRNAETVRPIEYIHTEELSAVMTAIINRNVGLTPEVLSEECAKLMGFSDVTPEIKQRLDEVIQHLTEMNVIRLVDGNLQPTSKG